MMIDPSDYVKMFFLYIFLCRSPIFGLLRHSIIYCMIIFQLGLGRHSGLHTLINYLQILF